MSNPSRSGKLTSHQYLIALGVFVVIPIVAFEAMLLVMWLMDKPGLPVSGTAFGFIWFFVGIPLIIIYSAVSILVLTARRARDAGLPAVVALPFVLMLLGNTGLIMGLLLFGGAGFRSDPWLLAAVVATFFFFVLMPRTVSTGADRFHWLEALGILCLTALGIVGLLSSLRFAPGILRLSHLSNLYNEARVIAPFAACGLILAEIAILWRCKTGRT